MFFLLMFAFYACAIYGIAVGVSRLAGDCLPCCCH
jgi:hypothetical protein